jgi:hypothetical protein
VSCQKAEIIFDVLGAHDITFPEGKVLTLNKKTNGGYDYEVGKLNACMYLQKLNNFLAGNRWLGSQHFCRTCPWQFQQDCHSLDQLQHSRQAVKDRELFGHRLPCSYRAGGSSEPPDHDWCRH